MSHLFLDSERPSLLPYMRATLLFVDDESEITNSLRRLFRPLGYSILTAKNGKDGLDLLEREPIDLVISDMRMPVMDGAEFLEQVRLRWPGTVRILLTGYADINSAIAAINKGGIERYISKPWNDRDITMAVQHALDRKWLEQERQRLEALVRKQNEELKNANAFLEARVNERTLEIKDTLRSLDAAHSKLKESFLAFIKVISNLIELKEGTFAGHSMRVAEQSRQLAKSMGLSNAELRDVVYAALLRDIGKVGLPDGLLSKPFNSLTAEERRKVMEHPAMGQLAIMGLQNLRWVALLIRCHHERYDGAGYPDGLVGAEIPLGARILAVVNDYDELLRGTLLDRRCSASDALIFIKENSGGRYDPKVVEAFVRLLGAEEQESSAESELIISGSRGTREGGVAEHAWPRGMA